jgi:hypothetical protein
MPIFGTNEVLIAIVGLLGLVVIAQVGFFQVKERKLIATIRDLTAWMQQQEHVTHALSAAIVALDKNLVVNKVVDKSAVSNIIWEEEVKET